MGKIVLVAPHSVLTLHPQLIPAIERGYFVEAHFENKLGAQRLQQFWQGRDIDALVIFGPLAAAADLTGLPPRKFAVILINPPFTLPEGLAKEPMLTLLRTSAEGMQLRLWGQCEKYVELICQLLTGLNTFLQVNFNEISFTEKEKEVLSMLLQGLRDDYIARALFISPKTVRNHISNMLRKVRVDSRTQLVLWALRKQIQA